MFYSFVLLLAKLFDSIRFNSALTFWRIYRQDRGGRVIALTYRKNTLRVPASVQKQ